MKSSISAQPRGVVLYTRQKTWPMASSYLCKYASRPALTCIEGLQAEHLKGRQNRLFDSRILISTIKDPDNQSQPSSSSCWDSVHRVPFCPAAVRALPL